MTPGTSWEQYAHPKQSHKVQRSNSTLIQAKPDTLGGKDSPKKKKREE